MNLAFHETDSLSVTIEYKICVIKTRTMKKIFILLFVLTIQQTIFSQGVKIGGTGDPDATAILELDGGAGKGLLLPRMTTTAMNGSNAANGMIVYNSTDGSIYLRKNSTWQKIAEGIAGGGGFTLPLVSTQNVPEYLFDLTNAGTDVASGAIKGFSESGKGIVGNSNTGDGGYFSSTTGNALVTGTGRVGIGTSTPMVKMHASSNSIDLLQLENTNALNAGVKVKQLFRTGNYYTGAIGTTGQSISTARLSFYTSAWFAASGLLERMSILDNGNVGIGTTAPVGKLEVSGKTILNQSVDNAAVEIKGAIKVSGSAPAAFVVVGPGINDFPVPFVTIDNPACNGKPNAMLFVTLNSEVGQTLTVKYDAVLAKWKIAADKLELGNILPNAKFNVLVIDK